VLELLACEMGRDKPRYFVTIKGCHYWSPSGRMKRAGFMLRSLGKDEVAAKQAAISLNAEWDSYRCRELAGETEIPKIIVYPAGSLGEAYNRVLKLRDEERRTKGIVWTTEQRARDDWPRAWKWIGEAFGDYDPSAIHPEELLALRSMVVTRVSESEAHRVIKVWRALWKRLGPMGYHVDADKDPSRAFSNTAPPPRQEVWTHREVLKLVQCAWRTGYPGLAAALAVGWDSMLSPVDVRKLTAGQRARDERGALFFLDRAKTGRAAVGSLSRWSEAILDSYLKRLAVELHDATPLFWSRGYTPGETGGRPWPPRPYTKDKLGEDFRHVRTLVFGADETRQLQDLRRSGSVEADAGGATGEDMSNKMANTIATSNRLRKTYNPVNVVSVRRVDDAREAAREQKRDNSLNSFRPPSLNSMKQKR
jgi:hypothetical protein